MTPFIILFLAIFIILIFASALLSQKKVHKLEFRCSKCGHIFKPYFLNPTLFYIIHGPFYFWLYANLKPRFFLRCPKCKKFSWCFLIKEDSENKIIKQ